MCKQWPKWAFDGTRSIELQECVSSLKITGILIEGIKYQNLIWAWSYPSCTRVYWTKACHRSVFIEILWHRQTHKQRESQDEFCSEAIQVAKLKKPNSCHACLNRSKVLLLSQLNHHIQETMCFLICASCYLPTYAKRRQYIAAIIGPGIDAKTAPNFPK